MYNGLHTKYPLFLSDFNKTLTLERERFSKKKKNPQILNFMTIQADLFPSDRQTGRHDEANTHFSQFRLGAKKRVRGGQTDKLIPTAPNKLNAMK
jgi:hypothetical protein